MDWVPASTRLAVVLTGFVSLLLGPAAMAANFLDARYDEGEDELVVTLAYRGTNPDHAFSLEWGACKQDGAPGSHGISARVLDSQWNDLARRSYSKTVRFDLRKLRCRPAIVTLFTAPQFRITVQIPARADTDRSLRGPRTDTVAARDFRSSVPAATCYGAVGMRSTSFMTCDAGTRLMLLRAQCIA